MGWFFVPTAFVSTPPSGQRAFADEHLVEVVPDGSPRLAMSWDEVRELSRGQVVASHTRTHTRLPEDAPEEALRDEILGSQLEREAHTGRRARSFAWLYGDSYRADSPTGRCLREAGYAFLFGNVSIQHIAPGG